MNILHVNEWTDLKGGVEVYISQLQLLIRKNHHQSFLIGINEYDNIFSIKLNETGISYKTKDQKNAFKILREFIQTNKIDLISIHNIFNSDLIDFCLSQRPVIKFAHAPVMVCPGKDKFWRYSEKPCTIKYGLHCFRHIYTEGCSNRHPKRVLAAWNFVNAEIHELSKKYKKIVVMSNYIRDGLLECGIDNQKIALNPYFTPDVQESSNDGIAIKKHFLFVGRMVSSKGPHILIKALRPVLESREDVHLDLVGDGELTDELKTIVDSVGLQSKVSFHGWLNRDLTDLLLRTAYIVFFPSIYPEAFGIVGIEAMMRGKPVIGFDVGGVSSWLADGETGFLLNSGDLVMMERKATYLLDNSNAYWAMSAKARSNALKYFAPHIHLSKLEEVFKEAVL